MPTMIEVDGNIYDIIVTYVYYSGSAGDYENPPEPAEVEINSIEPSRFDYLLENEKWYDILADRCLDYTETTYCNDGE